MIKGSFEALYERKCGTPWYWYDLWVRRISDDGGPMHDHIWTTILS